MTKLALALNTKVAPNDTLSMLNNLQGHLSISCSSHSYSYSGQHMKYHLSAWSWNVTFMNNVSFVNLSVAKVF